MFMYYCYIIIFLNQFQCNVGKNTKLLKQNVLVNQDNFIVFNNSMEYQHYTSSLNNCSKEICVKRKILGFFWLIQRQRILRQQWI